MVTSTAFACGNLMPMRRFVVPFLLLALAAASALTACVVAPPRPARVVVPYATIGIVEFGSNSERAINAHATRQFQEQVQAAQPGTRFIELGDRDAVLAAVGARTLDVSALKKIGDKYGVAAVFAGELVYSEPSVNLKVTDLQKLEGGMRAEMKGDISSRLFETASGASVWSSSAWAKRQLGGVSVSADHGVSGGTRTANPHEAMLPTLVYHLTHDFRPTSQRQPAR